MQEASDNNSEISLEMQQAIVEVIAQRLCDVLTTQPLTVNEQGPELDIESCLDQAKRLVLAHTLCERLVEQLRKLDSEPSILSVSRLEHCLQTATRAECAGKSDEYVFCSLFHDLGDFLAPYNHEGLSAAVVAPFVSVDLTWMIAHHGLIQQCKDLQAARSRCPFDLLHAFDMTVEFCKYFDDVSHDPNYESHSLDHFRPMIISLLSVPRQPVNGGTIFSPGVTNDSPARAPLRRTY